METRNGYIYVLLNHSMKDLVKIGRTSRNPEERVQELSQATGVPTPFILIYMEEFRDCIIAESQIHLALEKFRVSTSREFFEIPPYKAIKIIQNLKITEVESDTESSNSTTTEIYITNELGEDLYNQAEDYYYGLDDKLQDYDEAFRLYGKSAQLGYAQAYRRMGRMFEYGEGVKPNLRRALELYKEATKNGDYKGNAYMGLLYSSTSFDLFNLGNAKKCWDRYFGYINKQGIDYEDEFIMVDYLDRTISRFQKVEYRDVLRMYKDRIIGRLDRSILNAKEKYPSLVMKFMKTKSIVLNNFLVEDDLLNDFQARVRDVFGYKGNAVLFIEIVSGMISEGSTIEVQKGHKKKTAVVEFIDIDGDFVTKARSKDKEVSLVLKGVPREECDFFKSGASVALSNEFVSN
jgi:hypothetical protein